MTDLDIRDALLGGLGPELPHVTLQGERGTTGYECARERESVSDRGSDRDSDTDGCADSIHALPWFESAQASTLCALSRAREREREWQRQ